MAEDNIKEGDLDGLWTYLFRQAQTYHAAGDFTNAKALLKHLLRQPDINSQQRKDARHLLAVISYSSSPDDAPDSASKVTFRSACIRSWDFLTSIVGLVLRKGKGKEATPSQMVEYHNKVRAERIRGESGVHEAMLSRSYVSATEIAVDR